MLLTRPFPIVNVTYSKSEDGWKGDKMGKERPRVPWVRQTQRNGRPL
jgi:hypothetical protein